MSFSHLDEGTPEDDWIRAGALDLPPLLPGFAAAAGTLVVLAAHPDDEALGAAALLARAREWDTSVSVLLFTAGENSHPHSPTHARDRLKEIRLDEFDAALSALNGSVSSRFVDLPDGQLPDHGETVLREILSEVAGAPAPVTIVSPYSADGHGDHEALGIAALEAGQQSRSLVLEYPIWYWHWASTEDERWRSWRFLSDPGDLDRSSLFEAYASQTLPLSNRAGDEAILSSAQLEHHTRGGDTFALTDFRDRSLKRTAPATADAENRDSTVPNFAPARTAINDATTAASVFDSVHSDRPDPWSVRDSEYEIAKRGTLLARLPARPYSHILEIGCSIGVLSRELAQRGRQVTAVDASREALKIAESLEPSDPTGLRFVHATVPFDWPQGRFDCVVVSETGFYLSPSQLHRTLELIDASTTQSFVLVLCHWTGEIRDWPLDAEAVHETCLDFWPHRRLEFHTESDYRLDIITVTSHGPGNEDQEDW